MRGCPFRRTFCANPVYRVSGPGYRVRSPESIAAEAEMLYNAGYREIYLYSDELNVQHDWSVAVCQALAALGHDDLFFQCNLRAVPVTAELAAWLKRANFWPVRFGIESASQRVLRGIKKQLATEQTVEACRVASDAGLRTWGYFLLFQFWEHDGALVFETPDEIEDSLAFAWRLWRRGILHYSSWACAIPVPGVEMFDIAVRRGLIDQAYCPSDSWDLSAHSEEISTRDYRRLFAGARVLQAAMALSSGAIEWRNWRGILHRARVIGRGVTRWGSSWPHRPMMSTTGSSEEAQSR